MSWRNELLAVVSREKESISVAIGEKSDHLVGQFNRRIDVALVEAGFVDAHQRMDEAGVVVQIRIKLGSATVNQRATRHRAEPVARCPASVRF